MSVCEHQQSPHKGSRVQGSVCCTYKTVTGRERPWEKAESFLSALSTGTPYFHVALRATNWVAGPSRGLAGHARPTNIWHRWQGSPDQTCRVAFSQVRGGNSSSLDLLGCPQPCQEEETPSKVLGTWKPFCGCLRLLRGVHQLRLLGWPCALRGAHLLANCTRGAGLLCPPASARPQTNTQPPVPGRPRPQWWVGS